MKSVILSHKEKTLIMISRNLKTAKKEVSVKFVKYKFFKTLVQASQLSGELGEYMFIEDE